MTKLNSTITFPALPPAGPAQDADIFPVTQSGSDAKQTFSALSTYVQGKITLQSAYNVSSSPQITGSINFSDGSGNQFNIFGTDPNSIFQTTTTTKGARPLPSLTTSQENTLIGVPLGSSDTGLCWYNTTYNVPTFWDGTDVQRLLAIDNIIQGTNMTIVNNGDGTVTFSSSGGSGTTSQVNGSFTAMQNGTFFTPSTTSFTAIAVNPMSFTAIHQDGVAISLATINGNSTPIITNTAGGTRWCILSYDLGIGPSLVSGQTYTFCIAIQRNGGPLVFTSFRNNITIPTTASASGFKPISISGEIDLGTNDYAYLSVTCDTASQPLSAFFFNGTLVDTTVASLPSTDALAQGTNNLYLSQNGGATYQNVTGSITVGNIPSFSTTGGLLQDSGTSVAQIVANQLSYVVVTGTTQQMSMNTVYFVKGGSTVTFTLPATSSIAGRIEIIGTGTANWIIVPFSVGQYMEFNGLTANTSVQSGTPNDNLRILYPGDGSGEFNLEFSNGMQITLT
jgi:hypothetical protein